MIFNSLEAWFMVAKPDYRDILKAEGHTIEQFDSSGKMQVCQKCWDLALSNARWRGGKPMDWYRQIVREHRDRAQREASK